MMPEKKDKYLSRIQEQAARNKRISSIKYTAENFLQFVIVGGAASVPVLLLIAQVPKLIPTIISGIVAVTAALSNYYKFGECSRIHRTTFAALTKELELHDFQLGPYKNLGEDQAFDLFVERTELVFDEHAKKMSLLQEKQVSTVNYIG